MYYSPRIRFSIRFLLLLWIAAAALCLAIAFCHRRRADEVWLKSVFELVNASSEYTEFPKLAENDERLAKEVKWLFQSHSLMEASAERRDFSWYGVGMAKAHFQMREQADTSSTALVNPVIDFTIEIHTAPRLFGPSTRKIRFYCGSGESSVKAAEVFAALLVKMGHVSRDQVQVSVKTDDK